jgi:hypothetical protein
MHGVPQVLAAFLGVRLVAEVAGKLAEDQL